MTQATVKVAELSWKELCDLLLETDDIGVLHQWVTDMAYGGSLYRTMRVHGRMNAVRRAQEIKAIKTMLAAVNKGKRAA